MNHRTCLTRAALSLACATTLSLHAGVKLPALLTDNMVLQQQTGARFWGWAAAGEVVTVKGSWEEAVSATAGEDGKWKTTLKTPEAGGNYL